MAALHGGARPGAGRPKGSTTRKPPAGAGISRHQSALAYLTAVALGTEAGDALRVAAAKAVLPYESPKQRAPVESPPPARLRSKQESAATSAAKDDWSAKAAEVRRRLAAKKGSKA